MTEILFVHGALVRDGDWWWHPVAESVHQRTGIRSRAVMLPSCGETDAPAGSSGLVDDALALRHALDDADGDLLVVGHSYGGTVIAEGGDHPAVGYLLYISSYLPDAGQSQGAIMSDETDPVIVAPTNDGALALQGYDVESFSARFLDDVPDAATRAAAWDRVTTQGLEAFTTPTTTAAWQAKRSTYLVCTGDRSTSVELQRAHAARANRVVDLPTGHHPFISRPELVADEVTRILAEL